MCIRDRIGSIIAGTCVIFPWGYAGLAFARQMPDQITVELEKGGAGGGQDTAAASDSSAGADADASGEYDYGY